MMLQVSFSVLRLWLAWEARFPALEVIRNNFPTGPACCGPVFCWRGHFSLEFTLPKYIQQYGHLVDKCSCAAGTATVHPDIRTEMIIK
jgi:hypothetical protein